MNERVEQLLIGISNETLSIVARAVLDNPSAIVDETPAFEEITTSHYDLRTIGIVKVSGIASIRGEQYEWSSVVKFIDPSAGDNITAVLGSERKIYELGLFFSTQMCRSEQLGSICRTSMETGLRLCGSKICLTRHNRRGTLNSFYKPRIMSASSSVTISSTTFEFHSKHHLTSILLTRNPIDINRQPNN